MKRKIRLLAAALCAFALSFALVGCDGGETSAPTDYSSNFVGSWKLIGLEDETGATSPEDLALMESLGMYIVLELDEDKTASLTMVDELSTGTWKATGASSLAVTIEGETIDGTLEGGEITLAQGDTWMAFAKMTEDEIAAMGASGFSGSGYESGSGVVDESFAPMTIADDEVCTIDMVSKKTDDWGDSGFLCKVTNNYSEAIYVTAGLDEFDVNGVLIEFWGGDTIEPGQTKEIFVYAEADLVESLDQLVNVSGAIEAWEDDTLDTLKVYHFEA